MQLIVLSAETFREGETDIVNELFSAGMDRFHVRKPHATEQQTADYLSCIKEQFRDKISLHNWYALTADYNTGGIHYPEARRREEQPAPLPWQTKGLRLSTSVHSLSDATTLPDQYDYCFLSPVFNSISKPGYNPPPGKRPDMRTNDKKLIALGGVTDQNVEEVKRMGFGGAAVLGYIWQQPMKAIEHFRKINEQCLKAEDMY